MQICKQTRGLFALLARRMYFNRLVGFDPPNAKLNSRAATCAPATWRGLSQLAASAAARHCAPPQPPRKSSSGSRRVSTANRSLASLLLLLLLSRKLGGKLRDKRLSLHFWRRRRTLIRSDSFGSSSSPSASCWRQTHFSAPRKELTACPAANCVRRPLRP